MFSFLILVLFFNQSAAQEFDWVRTLEGKHYDQYLDCETDNEGNVVVIGLYANEEFVFNPALPITPSYLDSGAVHVIVKYNSKGDLLWSKSLGDNLAEFYMDLKIDKDNNIYVLGPLSHKVSIDDKVVYGKREYLLKLNSAGDAQWVKSSGGFGVMSLIDGKLFLHNDGVAGAQLEYDEKKYFNPISRDEFISSIELNKSTGEVETTILKLECRLPESVELIENKMTNSQSLLFFSMSSKRDTLFPEFGWNDTISSQSYYRFLVFDQKTKKAIQYKSYNCTSIKCVLKRKNGGYAIIGSIENVNQVKFGDTVIDNSINKHKTITGIYDKNHNVEKIWTSDVLSPNDLKFDIHGNIYLFSNVYDAEYQGKRLNKFNENGQEVWHFNFGLNSYQDGGDHIAFDIDDLGNVYISGAIVHEVFRITKKDSIINNSMPYLGGRTSGDGFLFKISASEIEKQFVGNDEMALLYPNPCTNEINLVVYPDFLLEKPSLLVYDVNGKVMYNANSVDQLHRIDMQGWGIGTYVLKLTTKDKDFCYKLLKL